MSQIQIGETLGSFRIESVLGSGAMGVVYRATNAKTNRVAAVKVLSSEFTPQGGKSKLPDRFEREAKILEQFRHPGIVRYLARGRFRGILYFAMEYIEGETLERVINERGALPWRQVVELGIQVCEALHYAHERGVVHRDLKPSNLMLTADGKVKLTDFGIAKDLDATALTATGRTLGTAAYMAPEQIKGTPSISHKTDLYALGIVFYQLLTGKMPFEGNTPVVLMHCHLNEPPPRPSARVAEIPKALDELIVNLMAKNPPDRPWDAAAVGMAFSKLRDKAERGAPIAMVWPSSQPAARQSSQAGSSNGRGPEVLEKPRKKSRKGRSSTALAPSVIFGWTGSGTRATNQTETRSFRITRSMVETGLLVSALLAIGGFIVYWLYPPSAGYLYHQAEVLMASSRRSDWRTARDEYIESLDSRFPNHPYREQTQKWRDKIYLDDAEGRATVLSSPVRLRDVNQPADNAERQFVLTFNLASDASQRGDDNSAKQQWENMSRSLKADDPAQRGWYLLALKRAKEVDDTMQERRRYVEKQLELVVSARLGGREREAITIWNKLVDQYGHFSDLADLFPRQTQAVTTPDAPHSNLSGSASQPIEDGKSSGTPKRRQTDAPHDAGNSENRSPSSSPDDEHRPKPATDQPKAEPGTALESSTSSVSSNTSPPNSVGND
jgi:serine/threonine-protein kinase